MSSLNELRRGRDVIVNARRVAKGSLAEVRTMRSKLAIESLPSRQRVLAIGIQERQERAATSVPVIERMIARFNAQCDEHGAPHMRIR